MVVLFNAPKGLWPPWPLLCVSKDKGKFNNVTNKYDITYQKQLKVYAKIKYAFMPIFICRWTVYLAKCPVIANLKEFGLRDVRISSNTTYVKIFNKIYIYYFLDSISNNKTTCE